MRDPGHYSVTYRDLGDLDAPSGFAALATAAIRQTVRTKITWNIIV